MPLVTLTTIPSNAPSVFVTLRKPFETLATLKGVTQLAQVDAADALILTKGTDAQSLTTIALP